MTRSFRLAATRAAMVSLAFAAAACSPKAPGPDHAAAASAAAPAAAAALPAACQSLLADMGTCADNLTRKGSPLGDQIRLSMTDMRTSIAGAPPSEVSSFCTTEATAFKQRADAAHC